MTNLLFDKKFDALLFDMDGTLLNSMQVLERVWGHWARGFGIDLKTFLPTIHGKQAVTTVSELNLPGVDPKAEAAALTANEIADVEGIKEIGGARAFLAQLKTANWAVVTSASTELANRRMAAAGIPRPGVLVGAEHVATGKPSPEGFLLAAKQLGVNADACLAIEDSHAGIAAAEAAGCTLLVISETHGAMTPGRHKIVTNYESLVPSVDDKGRVTITGRDAQKG